MLLRHPPIFLRVFFALIFAGVSAIATADFAPSFSSAKRIMKNEVYFDRTKSDLGTLYCGCEWEWVGVSGGRINAQSCGLKVRAQEFRAERIEWEHIVPALTFGQQRQCWQKGGRDYCETNDPVFMKMHADLHNLTPVVGEVNADRSSFRFGVLPNQQLQHGACMSKVDFKQRVFEPRDEAKGFAARVTFYMYDRYGLRMSRQQQQLLMAWDKMYPVTDWELERNRRIARIQGNSNPFVTGERKWTLGYQPKGEELLVEVESSTLPIIGNRNSKIYHLPGGVCASYDNVAKRNQQLFRTEAEAQAAGFRKAHNCR